MTTVRLWTIQTEAAWTAAQRRGVLRADGRRVWREFRSAYRWLMEQMGRRIAGCSGGYPVWAWYAPKPDLRRTAHLPGGTPGVRIELVAPAAQVLLSDFDAWHVVLTAGYLALSEEEDEAMDAWLLGADGRQLRYDELSPDRQAVVRASWERIFELEAIRGSRWTSGEGPQYIQAVVEEVRLDQVVSVTPFVAR